MSASGTELQAGSVFAGYRIEGFAGQGAMGVVYRASQIALERQVALKLIVPELADDAELPGALQARVAARGADRAPERAPRLRGGRGRRAPLHQHALGRGHGPALADTPRRPPGARPRGLDRRADRRGARCGAPPRPRPSRREARQRPHRPSRRRARLPHRLRPDQAHDHGGRAHEDGPLRRHAGLHAARADQGRAGRRARRRLFARLPDVPLAHRTRPVRARQRGGEDLRTSHRPSAERRRARAAGADGARRRGEQGAGEGARRPLSVRR